jgi:hypothetical protein
MTSPDETASPESPPFVITSSFQTANDVLFGARSNQLSNTGKPIIISVQVWENVLSQESESFVYST